MDWSEMLPADDTPMRNTLPTRRMNGLGQDEFGDASASGGLAAEMGAAPINHSGTQRAQQFGSFKTVAKLDHRKATLTGFVVPIETDDKGRMAEFLFVPFFGACIHVPPPPPNQIVYVHLAEPVPAPDIADPYELRGTLRVKQFDAEAASAAYAMDDATLIPKR